MKPIPFSWPWFLGLLIAAALLGSFSTINNDGVANFGASVRLALQRHDVLLLLAALISAGLLIWLLLLFITTVFGRKETFTDKAGH